MKIISNFNHIATEFYFRLKPITNREQDETIKRIAQEHVLDDTSEKTLVYLILNRANRLKSNHFVSQIRNAISTLDIIDVELLIEQIMKKICKDSLQIDINELLVPYLEKDIIEKLLGKSFEQVLKQDQFLFSDFVTTTSISQTQRARIALSIFFPGLIDSCINSFTYFNEGRVPAIPHEWGALLRIYQSFLMIPIAITYGLYQLLENGRKALTISIIIHGIALLALGFYLKMRPTPKILEFCRNLTLEYQMGILNSAIETDAIAQKMKVSLCPPQNDKPRHICLYGNTGDGKTEKLNALVKILPPGKQLILVNTAGVTKKFSDFSLEFDLLRKRIHGHEKDFIFVLDEIDAAAAHSGQSVKKYLQPILDPQSNGIAFIVITTKEGFSTYIKHDKEFKGRFKPIKIKPLSEIGNLRMLQEYALDSGSDVLIDDKYLRLIAHEINNPRNSYNYLKDLVITVRRTFDDYRSSIVRKQEMIVANMKGKYQLSGYISEEMQLGIEMQQKLLEHERKKEKRISKKIKLAKFLTNLNKEEKLKRIKIIQSKLPQSIKRFLFANYLSQLSLQMINRIELPKSIPIRVSVDR